MSASLPLQQDAAVCPPETLAQFAQNTLTRIERLNAEIAALEGLPQAERPHARIAELRAEAQWLTDYVAEMLQTVRAMEQRRTPGAPSDGR